jgi:hypothetical protein
MISIKCVLKWRRNSKNVITSRIVVLFSVHNSRHYITSQQQSAAGVVRNDRLCATMISLPWWTRPLRFCCVWFSFSWPRKIPPPYSCYISRTVTLDFLLAFYYTHCPCLTPSLPFIASLFPLSSIDLSAKKFDSKKHCYDTTGIHPPLSIRSANRREWIYTVQYAFKIVLISPDLLILFESSIVTVSLHLKQTTKTMMRKQQNTSPLDNVTNGAVSSYY